MIPKRPLLRERLGFLYCPPWRIQGSSVGGESTVVQIHGMDHLDEVDLKPNIKLRAIQVHHASEALLWLGYPANLQYADEQRQHAQ